MGAESANPILLVIGNMFLQARTLVTCLMSTYTLAAHAQAILCFAGAQTFVVATGQLRCCG